MMCFSAEPRISSKPAARTAATGAVLGSALVQAATARANIIGHQSGLSEDAALVAHAILGGAATARRRARRARCPVSWQQKGCIRMRKRCLT